VGFFSKLFGTKANQAGLGVDELARRLKMDEAALRAVKVEYRELRIPKKSGEARLLNAPADALKTVQRTILRRLLGKLSAHPSAMGFERGQSIATNAAPHVGAAVLLKMDIRDFFTATSVNRVREYFHTIGWNGDAADLLTKLTTYKGGLPQGAPTSPRLSNLLNYRLDAYLFLVGAALSAKYTRYADDMTFSFSEENRAHIARAITATQEAVDEYGYHLHTAKKLRIARRHDRMIVTGLVVNQRLNLPRATRRRLRAVEHHLKTNRPATLTEVQLRGWKAFESMVAAKRTEMEGAQPPLQ
jgi:RNA-directed DNA polymerase